MRVDLFTTISAGDMSGNIVGPAFSLEHAGMFSVQAVSSGSPDGTIDVQASNDSTTWDTITGATHVVSGADSVTFNIADCAYKFGRVTYTFSSGTGSLTVKVNTKGF